MDGRDLMSGDSGAPAKPKAKIFSMAQSQALLESRRLNTSYLQDQPSGMNNENASDSGMLHRRPQLQAAPRISLTHFLSNPAPRRPSTPLTTSRPLSSSHTHNKQGREASTQNGKGHISSNQEFRQVHLINRYVVSGVHLVRLSRKRIYSAKSAWVCLTRPSERLKADHPSTTPSTISDDYQAFQRVCRTGRQPREQR